MGYMTITPAGVAFTDLPLADVGAAAFQLEHDWFIRQDLVIRTAAGGRGTLLVEGTDYVLSQEDTYLSGLATAAAGAGRNVYGFIAVINVAYQAGALYFSGKYVADSNAPEDVEYRRVVAVSGADKTIRDDDGIGVLEVDPDGADRTVTLPTVADNLHRELTIVNSAAVGTAFKVIVEGEGAELINQVTAWWLFPGQSITLKSNGTIWRKIAGHVPMVHVRDEKAANTAGGTFTSGAFQTRTLNTIVNRGGVGEIAGASLAANKLTLPPGSYEVYARAPANYCSAHKAAVYDTTGAAYLVHGSNAWNGEGGYAQTDSIVVGAFVLAIASDITLVHRCTTTRNTDGFGRAANFGVNEVYAELVVRKVA